MGDVFGSKVLEVTDHVFASKIVACTKCFVESATDQIFSSYIQKKKKKDHIILGRGLEVACWLVDQVKAIVNNMAWKEIFKSKGGNSYHCTAR